MNEKEDLSASRYWTFVILIVIAVISFFLNPYFGIIIGFWIWGTYKIKRKQSSDRDKRSGNKTVNPETAQLIETIIREQASEKVEPYDYSSHRIRRGVLPAHVHNILDEMGITTWFQLSLIDEKELLYERCFGKEAMAKIRAELEIRGLNLNNTKTSIE